MSKNSNVSSTSPGAAIVGSARQAHCGVAGGSALEPEEEPDELPSSLVVPVPAIIDGSQTPSTHTNSPSPPAQSVSELHCWVDASTSAEQARSIVATVASDTQRYGRKA